MDILCILTIILSTLVIFYSIREFRQTEKEKHSKIKSIFSLVQGICYLVIVGLVLLKIISGKYIILMLFIFTTLDLLISYKIKSEKNFKK